MIAARIPTPCINAILRRNPRNSSRGAPMGDGNRFADEQAAMYLQRVQMVDGDYAPDGTYWGYSPKHGAIWCAFDRYLSNRVYVRALNRKAAVAAVLADHPEAVFLRA